MNRIIGILVLVLVLTAGGIIALVHHERNAMARDLAESRATVGKLEAELKTLRTERDSLQKQLQKLSVADAGSSSPSTAAPKGASANPATSVPSPAPAKEGAPAKQKPINAFAQMMRDPNMKEMMRKQQLAAMDMQYASLIAKFNLNDGEKADFRQLLAERLQKEGELGFKMMEDITPDQRKAVLQEYEDAKKSSDARIRDFLNSDSDFQTFKSWEDTRGERMQMDMGRSLFSSSGEPLTPEQEQQLVTTMHQVNTQPGSAPDLSKPQNFDPQKLTQADIDRQLASYDEKSQQVATQAAQFLTPKQLETLRTLQQQWRTMTESGLRMAASMFGTQDAPAK